MRIRSNPFDIDNNLVQCMYLHFDMEESMQLWSIEMLLLCVLGQLAVLYYITSIKVSLLCVQGLLIIFLAQIPVHVAPV